jgi:hypothetical protein
MMVGITIRKFPDPALARDSRPWTREVEDRIAALEKTAARQSASDLNTNKAQNSSIDLVSRNIVDLDARVQDAINSITITAAQITSGTIDQNRIQIDTSRIVSGTLTRPVDTTTVNAELYADNVTFNITTGRVANWARTSDGFIATATSSERAKTDIRPVDWDDAKIEAIVGMSLVYYRWIANLERIEAAKSPEHPDHGRFIHNPLEVGFIAERMHEAGLWEFVVYERNPDDSLMLDVETGEPIPFSIHYTNWSLALHEVVRRLWAQRQSDRANLDMVIAHLGLTPIATPAE